MLLTLHDGRADTRLQSLWPQRVWALLGKDQDRQVADVSDLRSGVDCPPVPPPPAGLAGMPVL